MTVTVPEYAPRIVYGDLDLTDAPFMVEFGFDLGSGVTVYDDVLSLVRDGQLVSSPGTNNRTITLSVIAEAGNGLALADAGVLLDQETFKPVNYLTFYPGDGVSPPLVLETFPAQSTHDWDTGLGRQGMRRFLLTIPALPGACALNDVQTTWSGPSSTVRSVSSATGWAVSTGTRSATTNSGVACIQTSAQNPTVTVTPSGPLDDFLWIRSNTIAGTVSDDVDMDLTIDGVTIPNAELFQPFKGTTQRRFIVMADTRRWRGITPSSISFKLFGVTTNARIYGFDATQYPNLPAALSVDSWSSELPDTGSNPGRGPAHPDFGIGALAIEGTMRARCLIEFTAPAGGAFVIAGPDPYFELRERGRQENIFGIFTVSDPDGVQIDEGVTTMWYGPGDHAVQIGRTAAQPVETNPDGIWPQSGTGVTTVGDDSSATMISYPAAEGVRVAFYDTSGAKKLVTPGPLLPTGYHGDALSYEPIDLWPGRGMFAVLRADNGKPITTTVTYRPRFPHYPNV